jgi:hypothetical protein
MVYDKIPYGKIAKICQELHIIELPRIAYGKIM